MIFLLPFVLCGVGDVCVPYGGLWYFEVTCLSDILYSRLDLMLDYLVFSRRVFGECKIVGVWVA